MVYVVFLMVVMVVGIEVVVCSYGVVFYVEFDSEYEVFGGM